MSPITQIIDKMITTKVTAQVIAVLGLASIPVIGPVLVGMTKYLMGLLITYLLTETIIGGVRIYLIENVDWEVKDVERAKDQLQDLLDNPSKYTIAQAAEIERGFDEAAVRLIHLVNAKVTI